MRTDEHGKSCPATLGEYRVLCVSIGGEGCAAVRFLDERINLCKENGENEEVLASDSQMRRILMPLLVQNFMPICGNCKSTPLVHKSVNDETKFFCPDCCLYFELTKI